MNFQDYVKNMSRKYKLAVAIAVFKRKPEGISIEQFINQIQEKIRVSDDNIDDFILCSADFDDEDFNTESNTILNDICDASSVNLLEKVNNNGFPEEKIEFDTATKNNYNEKFCFGLNKTATFTNTQIPKDDQTKMICDDNDGLFIDLTTELISEPNTDITSYDYEIVAKVAKNIDKNAGITNLKGRLEKTIDCFKKTTNNTEELCTNVANNAIKIHYKDTIDDLPKPTQNTVETNKIFDQASKIAQNIVKERKTDQEYAISSTKLNDDANKLIEANITKVASNVGRETPQNGPVITLLDSQDTILYTLPHFTQGPSQISQSQYQNVEVPRNFILGNNNRIILNQTGPEYMDNQRNSVIRAKDSNKIEFIIDKDGKAYEILQQIEINTQPVTENNEMSLGNIATGSTEQDRMVVDYIDATDNFIEPTITNIEFFDDSFQLLCNETNTGQNVNTHSENDKTTADVENTETEKGTSQKLEEVNPLAVPFKVVKELSRIKAYLDKRDRRMSTDGYSTDSGYRSDSQSQNSTYKSVNINENWIQQSAHCLYKYIVECPLVATTQEIVGEISLALAALIDKISDEECYPQFLEELLLTVENLLKDVYREGGRENILIEKDTKIQRLFLLNQSIHILSHSIEKITNLLQEIYTELTSKENLHELKNVQEIENVTYVFYVLENLLQKYVKIKGTSSQNTQNSPKVLKRSTITDIWRKKWNYTKETKFEGSCEKVCVLRKCGEILNKIIVDCMDGYGLVSYSALQCFNLLQSS